jgi:hypothetical protein
MMPIAAAAATAPIKRASDTSSVTVKNKAIESALVPTSEREQRHE